MWSKFVEEKSYVVKVSILKRHHAIKMASLRGIGRDDFLYRCLKKNNNYFVDKNTECFFWGFLWGYNIKNYSRCMLEILHLAQFWWRQPKIQTSTLADKDHLRCMQMRLCCMKVLYRSVAWKLTIFCANIQSQSFSMECYLSEADLLHVSTNVSHVSTNVCSAYAQTSVRINIVF
jgi:hypothetical protein